MLWRTHFAAGVNALWLLAPFPNLLNPATVLPLAAAAGFGALLPDLDASRSKIRSLEIKGIRPFVPFADIAYRALGHRGLLHSPAGWAGFGLTCLFLASWWGWEVPLGLFLGYGSHLLADAATRSGIPATGLPPWHMPDNGTNQNGTNQNGIKRLYNGRLHNKRLHLHKRLHLLPPKFRFVTGSQAEDVLMVVLAGFALLLILANRSF